ncbi:hypothetical protein M6D93_10250 [Jatrophihabitans telluris]|uniref:Uncharacterized protein n=1 Tax=Jatrophihabitans telluris TaxID=2038343 RepID=A0ABY4QT77_9ACTN|nr:hypothetical protein [Jatrophihabitans telluris]UQX86693.1 hypothetical protein M6D93_10250 [Jatrophihabitans telluris]
MNHPTHAPRTALLSRIRSGRWTAHPAFGVLALLAVAVLLIALGEPQPSSRPSGTSVVPSGSVTAPTALPATIAVTSSGAVLVRSGKRTTRVALPDHALARSVLTNGGLSVVLAVVGDHQHAYAIRKNLAVSDLGFADAVLPAARPGTAVVVEAAVVDPGVVLTPTPTASSSTSAANSATSVSTSSEPADYVARRFNAAGDVVGNLEILPRGMRVGADTAVGLVAWRPENVVVDGGVTLEPTSATAALLRPDGTIRPLGAIHPLVAGGDGLLVWDLVRRQFGLMPLKFLTSTATTTASPTQTAPTSPSADSGGSSTVSATPSATPTVVAGTRWFPASRGLTVTGPARFSGDATAFAVYAQVGSRRRLIIATITPVGTEQKPLEVLALAATLNRPSTASSSVSPSLSPAGTGSAGTAGNPAGPSSSPSTTSPVIGTGGFPIEAPLRPLWWNAQVVGLGTEGVVVGYQPGSQKASLLDIGLKNLLALDQAP